MPSSAKKPSSWATNSWMPMPLGATRTLRMIASFSLLTSSGFAFVVLLVLRRFAKRVRNRGGRGHRGFANSVARRGFDGEAPHRAPQRHGALHLRAGDAGLQCHEV